MNAGQPATVSLDTIASLAKRRGFVFPGSEIYGGLANTWDFGPLGAEVKRNIKNAWWEFFIQRRDDMVGLDGGILLHPRVWEASGHVEEFHDPLVDCRNCKSRFRADTLLEERLKISVEGLSLEDMSRAIQEHQLACPVCGRRDWTPVRQFNLMFRTFIGPVEEQSTRVYLRPETAQAIFVDFKQVLQTSRVKIPFGVGQIGKAFRNEITPGNFIFRLLEFEQMEIEYFIRPESWPETFEHWLAEMASFLNWIGLGADRIRMREHGPEELSHYSRRTVDFEYSFPFGWKELCGLAYRTDYDLRRHQEFSGEDLTYFDQERNERFIPHVVEPTMGVERLFLALLVDAYHEEPAVDVNGKPYTRVVLRFHPRIAPYKAAVLPLMRKPELVERARDVAAMLRQHFMVDYDETQSIGRRYRRQDEIGTPYCITIDYETLEDRAVTIRDRDTMEQVRVPISRLVEELGQRLAAS
ncbi:glycine--tRNA ligase [Thermomicrobiaceae bacterium CFH 74404]|uniref:Glycine--tRNA ligase n=1 Tax=Thermalbibacter longus TaxID=2951981 RepID=A0AA42B9W3_9BACT|nr:glycine--tRNA ligase [Thermalbibacter longus]MCM8749146.1 glycine--tRNA ligase [Thermalbibacter longus]